MVDLVNWQPFAIVLPTNIFPTLLNIFNRSLRLTTSYLNECLYCQIVDILVL